MGHFHLVRVRFTSLLFRSVFLYPPIPPFGGQRGCYCLSLVFSLSFCGDREFNKASLRAKQLVSQFCFVVLVFEGNYLCTQQCFLICQNIWPAGMSYYMHVLPWYLILMAYNTIQVHEPQAETDNLKIFLFWPNVCSTTKRGSEHTNSQYFLARMSPYIAAFAKLMMGLPNQCVCLQHDLERN